MTRPPREPNSLGDVLRWARELMQFIAEIEPAQSSNNTLTSRTTRGTFRSAVGGDEGGGSGDGDPVWLP